MPNKTKQQLPAQTEEGDDPYNKTPDFLRRQPPEPKDSDPGSAVSAGDNGRQAVEAGNAGDDGEGVRKRLDDNDAEPVEFGRNSDGEIIPLVALPPMRPRQRRGSIKAEPKPTIAVMTPTAPTDTAVTDTVFKKAVAKARQILADIDTPKQMQIGELADQVQKVYGEKKLKQFAKAIGISEGTVERYRSVWRAWSTKPKSAPEPKFYSVAKALEAHPDRFDLIKQNPDMTKDDADKKMKALRKKTKARSWQQEKRDNIKKQLDEIEHLAKQLKDAELILGEEPGDYRLFLDIVTPRRQQWIDNVSTGLDAGRRSIDLVARLEQRISEADRERGAAEDEAAARLEPYRDAVEALGLEPGRLQTAADGEADDADDDAVQEEDTYADAATE